jgi:hypothetical protein
MNTTTTEITPVETDAQIARENAAFEMLQRQAKMFASSSLVPKEFCGNLANCAIGINIAKRLGADPFMVLQNIDIIHGRPSFRATFLIAMVNASGRFEPLQFRMEETGKPTTKEIAFEAWENREKVTKKLSFAYTPTTCIAYAKDKASGTVIEGPPVSYDMAISEGWVGKAGSKWQTDMRELMIRYRAAAFFARLYAPDITLGMMTAEEAIDTTERDVTPPAESKLFKPAPVEAAPAQAAPLIDVEPVALVDQVRKLIDTSGVEWADALAVLKRNGITEQDVTLDEADEETLGHAVKFWPSIVKLTKGGSK